MERRRRAVHVVLSALVALDATLVVWAFGFPELWFKVFHGAPFGGVEAELFLARCGANWAAFLALQTIAWARWRKETAWLAVVAGVRWSDIFTDPIYSLLSESPTWFSMATLPAMGATNLALGFFLWRSYRLLRTAERAPG